MAEELDDDEEPDILKWQPEVAKDEWEAARQIAQAGHFMRLPGAFEIHEWAILEEFSQSVKSARIRDELLEAIHGTGAFRSFKNAIRRHHIEDSWYAFRTDALRQIAIDWCAENGIAWKDA